jgi:hypothetical protein
MVGDQPIVVEPVDMVFALCDEPLDVTFRRTPHPGQPLDGAFD